MHIKVHGGTPAHSESTLCTTCRHSTITTGRRLDEELVTCRASHLHAERIPFKVTSCSSYSDERQPTYMELLEQAWILQPGSRSGPAGFVRARDLREADYQRYISGIRHPDDV